MREEKLMVKIERKKKKIREIKDGLRTENMEKSEIIKNLKEEIEMRDDELSKYKSMCSRPESTNSVSKYLYHSISFIEYD